MNIALHLQSPPNLLLASLSAADFEFLRPHLKTVELVQGVTLFESGGIIDTAYFPHSGVVSLVVPLRTGEMIETGLIGHDSVAGGSAVLDGNISLNTAIVQIAGSGSVIGSDRLRSLAESSSDFRNALVRHDQVILVQAQQSAACNASHALEARLARWLLRCRDLVENDEIALTQEFLAQMLGVRRSSVSLVAGTLQQAGFIRYSRGHIQITNIEGLRECSCECYAEVKATSDRLLKFETDAGNGSSLTHSHPRGAPLPLSLS